MFSAIEQALFRRYMSNKKREKKFDVNGESFRVEESTCHITPVNFGIGPGSVFQHGDSEK